MVWDHELNERKRAILKSIIDDYIESAQPVGSRTIARKHELGLGSATIRNEMADLEELGYITQPHTSAGRIPSDKGYRFYVENLMQEHKLAQEEINRIREAMDERIEEINKLFRKASVIISRITGYTSVVLSPQLSRKRIKAVQLIKIDDRSILVVVAAAGGIVRNKLIHHNHVIDDAQLDKLNRAASMILEGQTTDRLTVPLAVELQREINMPAEIILEILESVDECIGKIETTDVYLEGITNILNYPEFRDLLKAREVLEILNEEEIITDLVKSSARRHQFDFRIGSENQIDEMKDLSIITTAYGREGKDAGAIGVIGPTRMAYSKVVSSIKYIRELLNKEMIRLFGDDP